MRDSANYLLRTKLERYKNTVIYVYVLHFDASSYYFTYLQRITCFFKPVFYIINVNELK